MILEVPYNLGLSVVLCDSDSSADFLQQKKWFYHSDFDCIPRMDGDTTPNLFPDDQHKNNLILKTYFTKAGLSTEL